MTKKIKKKKQTKVEIYFILYLAALILLLPDNKNQNQVDIESKKMILSLIPEKTVLNLRLLKSDGKNSIIKFDSTNKIYFDGDYDNIDFTYTISDVNRGETVEINELNNSKELFQIKEDLLNRYILFKWNPDFNFDFNSTYLVKLKAVVEKDGKSETVGTQFTLNTLFLNQVTDNIDYAVNSLDTDFIDLNYFNSTVPLRTNLSDMDAKVSKNPIITYADNDWVNYARIYNITSIDDLAGPPKVYTEGDSLLGGTAKFESSDGNNFMFTGMSPTYDTMKVTVKIRRKADNSEFNFDFAVIPTPRTAPDIPSVMYIGETYQFNTKLENNSKVESYTIIRAGSFEKKYSNNNITFTPDNNMLDANVTLTRYVENKKLDSYTLVLKKKPKPVIENLEMRDGKIILKTKTFSLQRNQNYIEKVITTPNLKFNDILGKSYFDDGYQFQTYESERLDKSINSIEIQLVDKYGSMSAKKSQQIK